MRTITNDMRKTLFHIETASNIVMRTRIDVNVCRQDSNQDLLFLDLD